MVRRNIYFSPNGMALGHAGRCIPVARELEKKGDNIIFSTYGDAIGFIERVGYKVLKSPEIKLAETAEGAIALQETSLKWPKHIMTFIRQVRAEIINLKKAKADIIISDSRLSSLFAGKLLNIPSILLLHQLRMVMPHRKELTPLQEKLKKFGEDFVMYNTRLYWSASNIILVPDFPPPFTIAKENLYVPKKILNNVEFIGQIIRKRPEQLPDTEEIRKKMGLDDRPIIYAGVAGTAVEKRLFTKLLTDILIKFPDKYQIIMTRGLPDKPDIPIYESENVKIYNWVSDRYSILKASDIVISKAGHNTISECFYYGKPTILVPTPGHSEHQGNARSTETMGVSKVIQQKDLNYDILISKVEEVLNDSLIYKRMRKIQKTVSKSNAIESIIKKIDYLVKK